jgi:membrane protein YdbS with pleckstrin-like domain
MIYSLFKGVALTVMKAPQRPPEPPSGTHGDVQIYRASRRYLSYRLLGFWLIFSANWIIPWGMLVSGVIAEEPPLLVLGLLLMPVLAAIQLCVYFAVRIDYDMRYYIVTDRSLRVREGAFIVKEKTISYANVQNLRVVQGPLLRFFGIWHLDVDTAGGGAGEKGQPGSGGHQVRLAGIESAHAVRDSIRRHLRSRAGGAGLGDLDDRDEGTTTSLEVHEALRDLKRATARLRATAEGRA